MDTITIELTKDEAEELVDMMSTDWGDRDDVATEIHKKLSIALGADYHLN